MVAGALIASTLAGVLALGASPTSATERTAPEQACFEQVPYTVYQYEKTTSTPTFVTEYEYKKEQQKSQYEIDKFTRERSRSAAIWQNFSPNNDQGPFEGPPSWPTDPRGTWQHQNKPIPPGQQGSDGVYQNGDGNGSWFYRAAAGNWTEWSTPTRWQPSGSHLAWVDVVPAANWQDHDGNGDNGTYDRDWTEYPTGNTRQVGTGTYTKEWFTSNPDAPWVATGNERSTLPGEPIVTVAYYNDGNVGPANLAVKDVGANWTTDQNLDRSWVQIDTDEFERDGVQIPCEQQPPAPDPTTKWGNCETGSNVVFGEQTTYEYVLNDKFQWLEVVDTVTNVQRELTEEEQAECQPADRVTYTEWVDGTYECGATIVTQTRTKTMYAFEYIDGAWVEGAGVQTEERRERPLTEDEFDPCPTTNEPPVAPQPPAIAPPTVDPIVEALPPLPPFPANPPQVEQLPPTSPATATELPATGSSTWSTLLLALTALGAGAAFLRLSRRSA